MNRYTLMILAGACSYGVLSTIAKLAYLDGHSIAWITLLQYAIGMAVLWGWTFLTSKKNQRQLSGERTQQSWLPVMLSGATIGLSSYVYYASVKYIPASLSIILLLQFTWIGMLLERLIFKKRPDRTQMMSVIVILAGTGLASGVSNLSLGSSLLQGAGLTLLSALLYALYIIANSRLGVNYSAPKKSALIMTGASLGILLVNVRSLSAQLAASTATLTWSLKLALFGTIVPPLLFSIAMPKVGAATSAIVVTVELPVAILCAHFMLGEKVTGLQWLGVAIMLSAIVWMNKPSIKTEETG